MVGRVDALQCLTVNRCQTHSPDRAHNPYGDGPATHPRIADGIPLDNQRSRRGRAARTSGSSERECYLWGLDCAGSLHFLQISDRPMHELYLSTETKLRIEEASAAPAQRWMQIAHSGIVRPALILIAGECAEFSDAVSILAGARVMLRYSAAHDDLSADGAELLLELKDDSEITMLVGRLPVPADPTGLPPRIAIFDLTPFAGKVCRLRLHCLPGSEHDPKGDWIAIYDLAMGSEEHLSVLRARAFNKERASNEIAHFSHIYEHSMYTSGVNDCPGTLPAAVCVPLADVIRNAPRSIPATSGISPRPFLAPGELPAPAPNNAFDYAHRLLSAELQSSPPMFEQRLIERCMRVEVEHHRPTRVLSLCSGTARFEAQFASGVTERAE